MIWSNPPFPCELAERWRPIIDDCRVLAGLKLPKRWTKASAGPISCARASALRPFDCPHGGYVQGEEFAGKDVYQLAALAKAGSRAALGELIARLSGPIKAILRCLRTDAKDAFQEVCVRIWRNIHQLEDHTAVTAWVLTIARNVCIDTVRRAPPHLQNLDPYKIYTPLNGTSTSESRLERQEDIERLMKLAHSAHAFGPEIVAGILAEQPKQDIAKRLGVHPNTITNILGQIGEKLKSLDKDKQC